ncbi:AI-2E family transporter [Chamaesiphon polymorphus]|uniref:AI-2E family transporter n=1 Tax=Chamaesiphon polymorphus CCALA 037 TaxID=2107692 RepID=A0A2T1GN96_9CYAN|nr:AI-2E family transporter [Chamaesiphon polymorphus]PSB59306.1 AI-2E family transporter [Chamaesiphon polymorphus CCALA 037]
MLLGQWLGFLALALSLYILWQIRQVLLIVFAAILLATALNKLARKLQHQFKLKRPAGVLIAIGIFIAVLVGFFILIVPPFISQFQELTTTQFPQILKSATQWRTILQSYVPAALVPYLPDPNDLDRQVQPLLRSVAGQSLSLFSSSLAVILNLLFLIVLTLMLLAQPMAYRQAFVVLFPSFYRQRIDGVLSECEVSLGKWFGGALLSMIVVAVFSTLGLVGLGIPLALAQGILAGLLNFIPNVGPTMSVVLPMSIALLDEPWKAVAILIIYLLIQQFESNLLTPYIMAQQVSLLPALTLIAQVFFTTFFGFLGLLLAIPLTVVAKIWINAVLIEDILDRWQAPLSRRSRARDRDKLADSYPDPQLETEIVMTTEESSDRCNSDPNRSDR